MVRFSLPVTYVGSVFTPGGLRWFSSHFRWLKVVPNQICFCLIVWKLLSGYGRVNRCDVTMVYVA
ncbi:hypothetical protein TanjilG_04563 [Lupinus angustifolius]|uniref:Uncharacterized protein n=1 Tax=Lupinus angustifolius TaxID=3871 RepID=A0A4P1RQV7_LUPAN|nr:hypothetical protein TanjilG_04563 [Lupinus angustifolius]